MTQHITEALSKLDAMISGDGAAAPAAASAASAGGGGSGVTSLKAELITLFSASIAAAFPAMPDRAIIAQCNQPTHGDYQCNNAMSLFGKSKGREGGPKSPRAAAEALVANLAASPLVEGVALAGPGFINIRLNRDWLAAHLGAMLREGVGSWAPGGLAGKRVVVDFRCGGLGGWLGGVWGGSAICIGLDGLGESA